MIVYNVNEKKGFKQVDSREINKKSDDVKIIVEGKVKYKHWVRFIKNRKVIIEGKNKDAVLMIPFDIMLHSGEEKYNDHREYINGSQCYFGGDKNAKYIFRNLKIKPEVEFRGYFREKDKKEEVSKKAKKLLFTPKLLFIMINHDSNVLFDSCSFELENDLKYIVDTWHDSKCVFKRCKFPQNMIFKKHHDSSIERIECEVVEENYHRREKR